MLFTVIIPTRNRPGTFATALASVLEQTFSDFEIIVVDDGSDSTHQREYQELIRQRAESVRFFSLIQRPRGHGPSYALNFGASHASGQYLCFLDDDDQWVDSAHLERAAKILDPTKQPIHLVLSNQTAFRGEKPIDDVVWIEDLEARIAHRPRTDGAYDVALADLLRCRAHCHLNTTIVEKQFYLHLGGLDETLRYEGDRDFYLRAIDHANRIKFVPNVTSRHNIPDPNAKLNMSTSESELAKLLYQLRVFDKATLFSKHASLRKYAMKQRSFILRHIANEASRSGQNDNSLTYTLEGITARLPSWGLSRFVFDVLPTKQRQKT